MASRAGGAGSPGEFGGCTHRASEGTPRLHTPTARQSAWAASSAQRRHHHVLASQGSTRPPGRAGRAVSLADRERSDVIAFSPSCRAGATIRADEEPGCHVPGPRGARPAMGAGNVVGAGPRPWAGTRGGRQPRGGHQPQWAGRRTLQATTAIAEPDQGERNRCRAASSSSSAGVTGKVDGRRDAHERGADEATDHSQHDVGPGTPPAPPARRRHHHASDLVAKVSEPLLGRPVGERTETPLAPNVELVEGRGRQGRGPGPPPGAPSSRTGTGTRSSRSPR